MKKQILLSIICCFSIATIAQTKKFTGMFFDIRYPSNFKVKDCPKPADCNGVTVVSPDKTVEFFVFSPQWNGDPGIAVTEDEKEADKKVTNQEGGIVITEVTITANNGSYTRSYYDVENTELNTRKTFGFKYKNKAAYNKYRAKYLAFKKSLQQYAD